MSKVVNGVASEYEMPMIYENKTTTNKLKNEQIFTVWQDPIIEKLQQENQQLKERNEFLIKRENKLQQIEMMFKNRSVDLEKLSKLLSEGSNE